MMLPNEFNNIIEKFGDKLVDKFDEYIKVEKKKNELLESIRNKLSDIAALQAIDIKCKYTIDLKHVQSDSSSGLQTDHIYSGRDHDEYCYRYYNNNRNLERSPSRVEYD